MAKQPTDNKPKRTKKPQRGQKPVITYDFKHPSRVSKDQTRTLENLHTNLARMMSSALSNSTQSVVDCDIRALWFLAFGCPFRASLLCTIFVTRGFRPWLLTAAPSGRTRTPQYLHRGVWNEICCD